MRSTPRVGENVIGSFIDSVTWDEAIDVIGDAASRRQSAFVCICNTHSLVEARYNEQFRKAMAKAIMCTPDGAPVAWMLRRLGFQHQARINGPDLMWKYFSRLNEASSEESVFLYGGAQDTLEKLVAVFKQNFPHLHLAGFHSPPFRALSQGEKDEIVEMINSSGAGSVWVSLGCPKQELWMLEHLDRIAGVMVGVGAAFDYHAGVIRRAPPWMQKSGLEWLHRLASEPRRLWRRYLHSNSVFVAFAALQIIRGWMIGKKKVV